MDKKSILLGFAALVLLLFSSTSLKADAINPASIYVGDTYGDLWNLDIHTRTATFIGHMGAVMTDLALSPAGVLYGITFDALYAIDAHTARTMRIGGLGVDAANALTFTAAGALYATDQASASLLQVDPLTGIATRISSTIFGSDGDLVAAPDGSLLLTASARLVSLDPVARSATVVGNTGMSTIYGMAFVDGTLYGITSTGMLLTLDPGSGAVTTIGRTSPPVRAFGASNIPVPNVPEPASLFLFGVGLLAGSRLPHVRH